MAQFEQVGVEAVVKNIAGFEKDLSKVAKSIEKTGKASDRAAISSAKLARAQEGLALSAKAVAEKQRLADRAVQKSVAAQEESAKHLAVMEKTATKAGVALLAFAAAGGAIIASSTKLAARVETLGVVTAQLGKNIGLTEPEVRKFEQSIKDQGITTQVARQAMAQMIQADIDLANATDLARIAQDAAVIANINSSESFERLTTVVATGNILMARRLGLNVDFQGSMQDLAKSLGKTTDELTQQEIIAARVSEVQRAGVNIAGAYGAAMETAGKKMGTLSRLVEESALIIGNFFLPFFTKAIDAVSGMFEAFLNLDEGTQTAISAILGFVTVGASIVGTALILVGSFAKIKTAILGVQASMIALNLSVGPAVLAIAVLVGVGVAVVEASAKNKEMTDSLQETVSVLETSESSYNQYARQAKAAAEATGGFALTQEELAEESAKTFGSMNKVLNDRTVVILSEQEFLLAERTRELAVANKENALAMQDVTFAIRGAKEESMAMAEILAAQDEAVLASSEALAVLDEKMVLFGISTSRVVEEELEKFLAAEQALAAEADELRAKLVALSQVENLSEDQIKELGELESALADNQAAVESLAESHQLATAKIVLGYAEQAAAAIVAAAAAANAALQAAITGEESPERIAQLQVEAERLNAAADIAVDTVVTFAEQMGLAGETTIQAFQDVQQVFADIESGVIQSSTSAVAALNDIAEAAGAIPTDITITVTVNTVDGTGIGGDVDGLAAGGPANPGQVYLVGEQGPELFVPGQRGVVVPNSLTRKFMDSPSGGMSAITNVENNFTMVNNNPNPDMFGEFAIMESQASGSI